MSHFFNVFAALACYRITKNPFIIHKDNLPFRLSLLHVFYHAFSKNEKVRKPFILLTHYILQSQKITFFCCFQSVFMPQLSLFRLITPLFFTKKRQRSGKFNQSPLAQKTMQSRPRYLF